MVVRVLAADCARDEGSSPSSLPLLSRRLRFQLQHAVHFLYPAKQVPFLPAVLARHKLQVLPVVVERALADAVRRAARVNAVLAAASHADFVNCFGIPALASLVAWLPTPIAKRVWTLGPHVPKFPTKEAWLLLLLEDASSCLHWV